MRGVPCLPCSRAGHFCPAVARVNDWVDEAEEPMCLDCVNDRQCALLRCAGRGREESSVSGSQNVFGEIVFPSEISSVICRTPEELGLARTVPDIPERKLLATSWHDGAVRVERKKRDHR